MYSIPFLLSFYRKIVLMLFVVVAIMASYNNQLYAIDNIHNADTTLFFSEYAEGSGNNKYLEIYNPTDSTINLDGYAYPFAQNGADTEGVYDRWKSFASGAVILPKAVYIIAHPNADPLILEQADETYGFLSNGNDGYALVKGDSNSYTILDVVGDWGADPGEGWQVCGVADGTKDHTLIKKSNRGGTSNWDISGGTNAEDCWWIVKNRDDWSHLGIHSDTNQAPIFPQSSYVYELEENRDGSMTSIVIDTIMATDINNDDVRYDLLEDGTVPEKFIINDSTGVLSYVGTGEDFESEIKPYDLLVVARDSALQNTAQVVINIVDVNEPTIAVGIIPEQTLIEDNPPHTLDLSKYFSDDDDNIMTYTATSNDTTVIKAEVVGDPPLLILTPVGRGHSVFREKVLYIHWRLNRIFFDNTQELSVGDFVKNSAGNKFKITEIDSYKPGDGHGASPGSSEGKSDGPGPDCKEVVCSDPGIALSADDRYHYIKVEGGVPSGFGVGNVIGSPDNVMVKVAASDGQTEAAHDILISVLRSPPQFESSSYGFELEENRDGSTTSIEIDTIMATDPNDDDVSYTLLEDDGVTVPEKFIINDSTGGLFYVGTGEDFETTRSITFLVVASNGLLRNTAQVTINIVDVNEAPSFYPIVGDTLKINMVLGSKDTVHFNRIFYDPEGDVITFSISEYPDNIVQVEMEDSIMVLTALQEGSTSASIVGTDIHGDSTTFEIDINVEASTIPLPPVFLSSSYDSKLEENRRGNTTAIVIDTILAIDPNKDVVSYALLEHDGVTEPERFEINSEGVLSYIGNREDFETTPIITFLVVASDGMDSSTANVEVTITNVNEGPMVYPAFSIRYNIDIVLGHKDTVYLNDIFYDPEGDPLTYYINPKNAPSPDEVTVEIEDSIMVLTALKVPIQQGTTFGSLHAFNENGNPSTFIFIRIHVSDIPLPPVFLSSKPPVVLSSNYVFELEEDQNGTGTNNAIVIDTVRAIDPNNDVVSYALLEDDGVTEPEKFEINSAGVLSYVGSGEDFESEIKHYDLLVVASDGMDSSMANVEVRITNVNERPLLYPAFSVRYISDIVLGHKDTVYLNDIFYDPEGDPLTYYFSPTFPADVVTVEIDNEDSIIVLTALQPISTFSFLYAKDETLVSDIVFNIELRVSTTPLPPAFLSSNYVFELEENQNGTGSNAIVIDTIRAIDPNNDGVKYALLENDSVTVPEKFIINDSTGVLSYVGMGEDFEVDSIITFLVAARDDSLQNTAQVRINIVDVNDAPERINSIDKQILEIDEDPRSIDLSLYFRDEDGDVLHYSFMLNNDVVNVQIQDNLLILEPVGIGMATITIQASDTQDMITHDIAVEVVELDETRDDDQDGYIDISKPKRLKLLSTLPMGNYELVNDIDLDTDAEDSVDAPIDYFGGTLKGNGYVIRNFKHSDADTSASFFRLVDSSAVISDICLIYASVQSSSQAAVLAVENRGEIINSCVWGEVEAGISGSGLVHHNEGLISNSYAIVQITSGSSSTGSHYAGLVGINSGMIRNSYAVNISPIDEKRGVVGGLVSENRADGEIHNSYTVGYVKNHLKNTNGFFVGRNQGSIQNSYWDRQWDELADIPGMLPSHVGAGNDDNIEAYTYNQMIEGDGFLGPAFEYITNDYPRVKKMGSDSLVGGILQANSYMSDIRLLDNPSKSVGRWNMLSFSIDRASWHSFTYSRKLIQGYDEDNRGVELNMYYDYDGTKWIPDINSNNLDVFNLDDKYKTGKGFILASFGTIETPIITYGYPNTEDKTVALYKDPNNPYWNLLGNPYDRELPVSVLDISQWQGADDLYSYQMVYWDGEKYVTSASNLDVTIPTDAGFFIHNDTSSSITMPYPGSTSSKQKSVSDGKMNLVVSIDGYNRDRSRHVLDEVALTFSKLATLERDKYDLELLDPFYSYDEKGSYRMRAGLRMAGDDKLYRIISLPKELNEKVSYDLSLSSVGGIEKYEFKIDASNIPEGWLVYIEDRVTGNRKAMVSDGTYSYHNVSVSKQSESLLVGYAPPKLESVRSSVNSTIRLVIDPHGEAAVLPPLELSLHQNYPNPFNPVTVIPFDIPERMEVSLRIYNILGQQVTTLLSNKIYEAGRYELSWDASRYASGLYIYVLDVGDQRLMKKLTLIK